MHGPSPLDKAFKRFQYQDTSSLIIITYLNFSHWSINRILQFLDLLACLCFTLLQSTYYFIKFIKSLLQCTYFYQAIDAVKARQVICLFEIILEGDIFRTPPIIHVKKADGERSYAFWQSSPSFLKCEHYHIK